MPVTPVDGASRVQACAIRVARLSATGTTPAGASNMYQNKRFVKVTTSPVIETGAEQTLRTACGDLDVNLKDPDLPKRRNMTVEITYPDPELLELIEGGAVLLDGSGSSIGYAEPALMTEGNPNGCSIEVWEKAVLVDVAATPPFFRWAYPMCKLRQGDVAHQSGPGTTTLTGYASENANWGNGPTNDWTADGTAGGTGLASGRVAQWIRSAALPTPLKAGYQATPVQA